MVKLMQNKEPIAKNIFSNNLFWDIDPLQLDMDRNKRFIIQRVLEYGLLSDWHFIKKYYGLELIATEMKKVRSLNKVSLEFICTLTNTKKEDYRCYTSIQSTHQHWNF